MRSTTEAAILVVFAFALALALEWCASGCVPHAREAEAESAYLAEQLRCVDIATSRAEADVCRREVRKRWGITEVETKRRDASPAPLEPEAER